MQMNEGKGRLACCQNFMELLIPNSKEEVTKEKHIPHIISKDNSTIEVQTGKSRHVMSKDHYINWIAIFGDDEWVIKWLEPEVDIPYVVFNTEKQNEIYSYCNLHGLWKTNIKVEKEIE